MDRSTLEALSREDLIALVLAQAEMIAALTKRVAELEAKLGLPPKTPDNSSVPPSQGQKANVARAPKRRRRQGREGRHRALDPNPTERREIRAERCPQCLADLSGAAQAVRETYDHVEIPALRPMVTRVELCGGTCPACAARFKAEAPADMPPGSPYGPNLRAMALHLRFSQHVSLQRLAGVMRDVFGLAISEGALVNLLRAAAEPLAAQAARLRARLLEAPAIASDETTLRVAGLRRWLWVFHAGDTAVFLADKGRGKDVPAAFLGDRRPDFWLSDRLGSQMGFGARGHQYCLAHLIRDARYAEEAGDGVFAPGLIALLRRACRIGRLRERFTHAQLADRRRQLVKALSLLLEVKPEHPEGAKLHAAIGKIRRNLFVFVTERALEPTNNASERALRPCTTWRKVTNGLRTAWGAALYADIRSLLETARRRAIPPLEAIAMTLRGMPLPVPTA
jgi:transposase